MSTPRPAIPNDCASYLTQLLPYLEQTNVYNLINISQSTFNTANIPPCTGAGAIHSGTNSAYSIVINAFLCPSTPAPPTINYFNCCWGPYGNGGGDACSPGAVGGNPGVTNLNPPPTQIWARTDYFPIPGLHNSCSAGRRNVPDLHQRCRRQHGFRDHHQPADHRHDPDGVDHGRHFEYHDRLGVRWPARRL